MLLPENSIEVKKTIDDNLEMKILYYRFTHRGIPRNFALLNLKKQKPKPAPPDFHIRLVRIAYFSTNWQFLKHPLVQNHYVY